MKLPIELVSCLIREATDVPEAFDTSQELDYRQREHILELVQESMSIKTTLSLVSKAFHKICDPFLYEIIVIYRFKYVPHLLKLLRHGQHRSGSKTRGSYCRRLDIYVTISREEHLDIAWREGGHTLWGLIPACPFLHTLHCRLPGIHETPPVPLEHPQLTHNALWKCLATHCADTLRALELYGFYIRMDRVEMMLRYFSVLETCAITDIYALQDLQADYIDWEVEPAYDQEEPPSRWTRGLWYSQIPIGTIEGKSYDTLSGWFDNQALAEFETAKIYTYAAWPAYHGSGPLYLLPNLHTLSMVHANSRLDQFLLPGLRTLAAYTEIVSDLDFLTLTHASYPNLTHLHHNLGDGVPLSSLLRLVPNLIDLKLTITPFTRFTPSNFTFPMDWLVNITLIGRGAKFRIDATVPKDLGIRPYVHDLLGAVKAGMLPALSTIRVPQFPARKKERLPITKGRRLGVELILTDCKAYHRFRYAPGRYDHPER
ncbi:hypothetical protein H0H81_009559 [Sphagnurus paluster]|uniref:Uncharacterized protein n=1 Tax=Sphagnurus paluster TaxID=117069 RepID=A0A9P7FS26_9AGAR|nr:hypothetical protein H0H81_009559 [Sphagnurus paluster]